VARPLALSLLGSYLQSFLPGFRIAVVLNWFEDLKARVPAAR